MPTGMRKSEFYKMEFLPDVQPMRKTSVLPDISKIVIKPYTEKEMEAHKLRLKEMEEKLREKGMWVEPNF